MLAFTRWLLFGTLISKVCSVPTAEVQNPTSLQANSSLKVEPWPRTPFEIPIGSSRQPDFGFLRFDALGREGTEQQQAALLAFFSNVRPHITYQQDSARLVGVIPSDHRRSRTRLIFKLELSTDEGTSIPDHYQISILDKVKDLITRHGLREIHSRVVRGFVTNGAFSLWPVIGPQQPVEEVPICVAITGSHDNFLQIQTMGTSLPLGLLAQFARSLDNLIEITFDGLARTDKFTGFTSLRSVASHRYSFRVMPVRPFPTGMPDLTNRDVLQALGAWKAFFLDYQGKYFRSHTFDIYSSDLYGSGVVATASFSIMTENIDANTTSSTNESSSTGNANLEPSVVPSTANGDVIFQKRGLRFRP